MSEGRPTVAVYIDDWLKPSETFVRSQVESYQRWDHLEVGLGRIDSPTARRTDLVVSPEASATSWTRRWQQLTRRLPAMESLLADRRASLVHAHFGNCGTNILPTARRLGLPLVVTFHGYDATTFMTERTIAGLIYRRRLPELYDYATVLIAVSDHIAQRLIDNGAPPDKVVTRRIGVPMSDTTEAANHERRGVLFVGRLSDKKGVLDLVDAYAALPAATRGRHPLTIIGEGELSRELDDRIDASGVDVHRLGAQPPARVAAEMSRHTVVAVPSRTAANGDTEGLPTVVYEAARAGTPIVATRHAGIPEAVEDDVTGLLVPERDVVALTTALLTVLEDEALAARLGAGARARAESDFDVTRLTAGLESIYDDIIATHPGARRAP